MPFKWTDAQTRQANIVDAETFDKAYNPVKGLINGGLDRENLPNASVADVHLSSRAFLKHAIRTDIYLQDGTTRTNRWGGAGPLWLYNAIGYDVYSSGWKINSAQPITSLFKEGMIHLEFNCWAWLNEQELGVSTEQSWLQFAILMDGNPVIVSGRYRKNMNQVHLVGDIPIPTGSHQFNIAWRMTPRHNRDEADGMMYYGGGSLLALNRYR
tara:strand:- start:4047 stop:4682 length:636 start_codon:yes stop_codon:yes gene_type:complete